MSRRMIGKLGKSQCGCCDQRAGTGKGKVGWVRRNKRREREELKRSAYDV
jgi:hypothetical protein